MGKEIYVITSFPIVLTMIKNLPNKTLCDRIRNATSGAKAFSRYPAGTNIEPIMTNFRGPSNFVP